MSEKLLYAANMLASRCWRSQVSPEKIKEIVVVKWDEIGDMVTAVHVFQLLKDYAPQAQLTLLCKPFVGSLIQADPHVDKVVFGTNELPKKADVWIELRGTWHTWWLSLWRTKKVRLDRGRVRFLQRGHQPHERITNFRIVEPLVGDIPWITRPLYIGEADAIAASEVLSNVFGVADAQPFMVVHPGGRSALRRWPALRFVQIIKEIFSKYGWKSVVIGTPDEADIIEEIERESEGAAVAWITTSSLGAFASVISRAELFLGNESGPLQIADAMGVKSIGLFGPGVKDVFYPQTTGSKVLHHILDCNPCDQVNCTRPENKCIDLIQVQEVLDTFTK